MIDEQFERLTVVEKATSCKNGSRWLCRCDCGNETIVARCNLVSGHTKSCGCLSREKSHITGTKTIKANSAGLLKHGEAANGKTKTYRTWVNMKTRCYNPKAESYEYYGAVGVRVCDRWLNSFENFYADMGVKPADMSIDRIDPYGNYEPGNCRYTDAKTQARNKR